jgi:hypothetical protein
VGIERVCARSAQRKELCCEFKETESLRILEGSARWASSKCIGAQGPRTTERSVEKRLRQEGVEKVCKQAQENRELFEFCHLKEESKEGSSLGC